MIQIVLVSHFDADVDQIGPQAGQLMLGRTSS